MEIRATGHSIAYKVLAVFMSVVLTLGFSAMIPVTKLTAYADDDGLVSGSSGALETQVETFEAPELKSNLRMFNHFQADKSTVTMSGDEVKLAFVTDGSTASIQKYSKIALGKSSELFNGEDLVAGAPNYSNTLKGEPNIIEGVLQETSDGKKLYSYEIPFTRAAFEEQVNGGGIYITIFNDEKHGWYKPDSDPYLTVGNLRQTIELAVANEELMWPIVKAYIENNANGPDYLVVYANGTSYDWFFSGTQAEAVASEDKAADPRWAKHIPANITSTYVNSKGDTVAVDNESKYGYRLPITLPDEGEFTVPIVAVANTSGDYTKRRADIDLDSKTAVFGNYSGTIDVAVSSDIADLKVGESGSLYYKGYLRAEGTSNEWESVLTVTLADGVYDKAYVDPVLEGAEAETRQVSDDGSLEISMTNIYNGVRQLNDGKTAKVKMHVADNAPYKEAGTWVDRTLALDVLSGTAAFSGQALTAPSTEQPSEGQQADEQPAQDQQTTEQPSKDQQTTEQPSKDQQTTEQPAQEQSGASETGLAIGEETTTGTGAEAADVKAASADEVTYVAPASKATKKVTVPDTVAVGDKTYKVTKVASNAFKGSKATSVKVGKNVTSIAKKAFAGASKLAKVTITSKSLKSKKAVANAFKGSKVKTVTLKGMTAKQKKAVKAAILKYGGKKDIVVK